MNVRVVMALALFVPFTGSCGGDGKVGAGPPPADLVIAGAYDLVSAFDLTTSALLPEPAYGYLQDLKSLRDDPAATFFRLLEDAGVPLAGSLLAVLPGPLASRVKGWINEYVFGATFQGTKVTTELDLLLEQAAEVLTRFQVGSDLLLRLPDAGGNTTAAHGVRTLRFSLWGGTIPVVVPIDLPAITLPNEIFVTDAETSALVTAGGGGSAADARLVLGDHAFGIPYGRLAFGALNLGSHQRYGADVRGALGALFACSSLGASVAQRCVLGVCVGHAAEVTAICERGLDEVVARMRERIEALNFNALRLKSGRAEMWDEPATARATADRRIDLLDDGYWDASIDIGMGARAVPATFAGARTGQ